MIATFRFNLYRLWLKTNPFTGELNWRHSIVVPIVGLYYLYVNRDDLLRAKMYVAWSGLPILVFGILFFGYGIWPGQNDYVKDLGMVVAIFGVVALLCGWQVMKIAWFPIAFLICAMPWPELVYSKIASPLQHLAASVAVGTLRMTGVESMNQGTKILMYGDKGWMALNVAEACAGLAIADDLHLGRRGGGVPLATAVLAEVHHHLHGYSDRHLLQRDARQRARAAAPVLERRVVRRICPPIRRNRHADSRVPAHPAGLLDARPHFH